MASAAPSAFLRRRAPASGICAAVSAPSHVAVCAAFLRDTPDDSAVDTEQARKTAMEQEAMASSLKVVKFEFISFGQSAFYTAIKCSGYKIKRPCGKGRYLGVFWQHSIKPIS